MKAAIEKFTLDNGLTVLLENIPYRVTASVGLFLPVGSRFETKKESGYSHFVEHMLFKGTKKRDYTEISRAIDRLGGFMNASTSREMTDYYVNLSGRHISIALDVIADMFYDSLFTESEFLAEKKVIIEELKMNDDQVDETLFDFFYRTQWGDTPLGRSIAGSTTGVSRISRNDLYEYYITHYGPEGAVLSLAGALFSSAREKKELIAQIRHFFDRKNHALKGKLSFSKPSFATPEIQGEFYTRQKSFKHQAKELEQINFVVSFPGEKNTLHGGADIAVLTHYLGGTMSSRLFTELREKRGLCYSVSAFHSQLLREGVWGIFCATSPKKYALAVETALSEMESLALGLDAGEIAESKSGLKGAFELMMESVSRRSAYNAQMELYHGVQRNWREVLTEIDSVTPTSILFAYQKIWKGIAPSVTSVGPKILPATETKIRQAVKKAL
ncbi:MAG: putative zinc protease [Turneriella sp.]|nr:putative zinc protease [Turneriella sp.]